MAAVWERDDDGCLAWLSFIVDLIGFFFNVIVFSSIIIKCKKYSLIYVSKYQYENVNQSKYIFLFFMDVIVFFLF